MSSHPDDMMEDGATSPAPSPHPTTDPTLPPPVERTPSTSTSTPTTTTTTRTPLQPTSTPIPVPSTPTTYVAPTPASMYPIPPPPTYNNYSTLTTASLAVNASPYAPPLTSPHLTSASPSPARCWPPSSPRVDVIPSVTQRVDTLIRSGRVSQMMRYAQEYSNMIGTSGRPSYMSPQHTVNHSSGLLPSPSARPPLLEIDRYLRRRHVFQVLDADMVVRGTVYNKTDSSMIMLITEVCTPPPPSTPTSTIPTIPQPTPSPILKLSSLSADRDYGGLTELDDLGIYGICHFAEIMQQSSTKSSPSTHDESSPTHPSSSGIYDRGHVDRFNVGDTVKALVISVDVHSEKMYVSLNNARMRGLPHSHHRLGLFTDKKDTPSLPTPTSTSTPTSTILPTSFTSSSHYSMQAPYGFPISTPSYSSQRSIKRPSSMSSPINLCTSLQQHALFKNPEGITIMQHAYHIHEHGSLLAKHGVDGQSTYKNLRHQQNQAWAKESVVKGISLAKKGQYENALKCYKHALDIEPQFTQAYVARGAAYVLQGDLERAIIEFETALHIDPQQQYALTYLQAAREKLSRKMTNHSPTTIQPIPHTSPHHETSSSSSSSSPCHDDTETILLQQERNRGKEIERLMKKQKREREGGNEKKSKKKDKKRKSRKKEKKKEKKKEDRSRKRKYDTNTEDEHHEDEKEERHSRRRSRHSDREHRHKHSHSSSPQLPAVHSLPSLPPDMAFPSTALPMPHYATRHSPSHDLPSPTALPTSDANVVMEDESPIRTTIVPPADLPLTVPAPAISKHVVPSPQLVTQDDRIHAITSIQNLYDELRAEARHITRTVHHRGEPPTFEKTNHDDEDMDGVQDVIATLPTAPVNENGTKTVLPMPQSS